ncbi:hypothetical protein A2U01_0049441, partial [Trifolium medium]|nr:hypothetical protein [Trifolium medium]
MLFENQIPMFILYVLSQTVFPQVFGPNANGKWFSQVFGPNANGKWSKDNYICDLVLNLLGYSPLRLYSRETAHILDLVCLVVNRN